MVVLANMQNITPVGKLFFRLWQHMSLRRRHQFILLLVLMVIASFAEIISIGSVIPFLSALTSPENFFANPLAQPLISFLRKNLHGKLRRAHFVEYRYVCYQNHKFKNDH